MPSLSPNRPSIFIAAGEASGDQHAAALVRQIQLQAPSVRIQAAGGSALEACRPEFFLNTAQANATGATEIIRHLPYYFRTLQTLIRRLKQERPSLLILVDNPGFNLRLGKAAGQLGIPVLYFICPQVWAWHESRVNLMQKFVRKALVIFDFEEAFFKERGLDAVWVGHPLTDRFTPPTEDFSAALRGRPKKPPVIALLPGSRQNEIQKLLPILLESAALLAKRFPGAVFRLIEADTLPAPFYDPYLPRFSSIERIRSDRHAAIRDADLAIVCSGTATLECALLGTPMVIVNRGSWLTGFLAKRLIRVPYLGLPNLLAQKLIVPELLQEKCTPKSISNEATQILSSPDQYTQMVKDLNSVWEKVGKPGAPARAATEVLQSLQKLEAF